MKLPLRYDPDGRLMDADGRQVADFELTDFELPEDDAHGTQLATAANCFEELVAACEGMTDWVDVLDPPDEGCDGMEALARRIEACRAAAIKAKGA